MHENSELDRYDEAIVEILSREGRLSVSALSQRVALSKTPCQQRLKRLQATGVIRGFRAVLDPAKMHREQVAFVEVKLSDTSEAALSAFNAAVHTITEVEQCHMIAGAFDYLLKVRSRDIKAYRQVLGESISTLPFVASTSTHISMQAVKDEAL